MDTTFHADMKAAVVELEGDSFIDTVKLTTNMDAEGTSYILALRDSILDLVIYQLDPEKCKDDFKGSAMNVTRVYSSMMLGIVSRLL